MCDDLAGLGWLPKRFGVQQAAVHQWRRRGLLPEPLRADGVAVPVWRKRDLDVWGYQTGRLIKALPTRHERTVRLGPVSDRTEPGLYPAGYPLAEIVDDLYSEAAERRQDLVRVTISRMRRTGPGGSQEVTDVIEGDKLRALIQECHTGHDSGGGMAVAE